MADGASTATAASDRDLDARLQQALHQYFATPRMLAQGDINVDMADYDERTPLHLAASNGHLKMVKHLAGTSPSFNQCST